MESRTRNWMRCQRRGLWPADRSPLAAVGRVTVAKVGRLQVYRNEPSDVRVAGGEAERAAPFRPEVQERSVLVQGCVAHAEGGARGVEGRRAWKMKEGDGRFGHPLLSSKPVGTEPLDVTGGGGGNRTLVRTCSCTASTRVGSHLVSSITTTAANLRDGPDRLFLADGNRSAPSAS